MRTFAAWAALLFLCAASVPASAEVARDGLVFSGRKVFSYEGERAAERDSTVTGRFDQAFQFAVRGDVTDRVKADLRFDDTKADKVDRMEFTADFEPLRLTVGDFTPPALVAGLSATPLRGLRANYDGSDAGVDLFVSRPATPLRTSRLEGDGGRGPYFLNGGGVSPETETVFVRSIRRYKNIDYVVDYASGALEFLEPVPVGDPIEAVYRADETDTARPDLLFGVGSRVELGRGAFDLNLVRRESGAADDPVAHTLLDVGQKVSLGGRNGVEARVSQTLLESPSLATVGDRSLSLLARTGLGPADLKLSLQDTGAGYRPLFARGDSLGRRAGITLDRGEGPIRPSLRLERVAGDGAPDRDELTGGLDYAPDPRLSLRGEMRMRRPDALRESDLLARLATSLTLPGVRVENRMALQDDLGLFATGSGIDRLSDAEWRVSTSPARRTVALLDLRDRSGLTASGDPASTQRDRTLKLLRRIDGRTNATLTAARVAESGAFSSAAMSRRDGTLGVTRRLSAKTSVDAEFRSSAGEGPYAVNADGGSLGLRVSPRDGMTLHAGAGVRSCEFVRFGERASLGSGEMRLVYAPERKPSVELSGRREEVGFDPVTGIRVGDRTSVGGRLGLPLSGRGKVTADLSRGEDRAPERRRTLSAGAELSLRVRPEVQFFLYFLKQSRIYPDEDRGEDGSARGGFRVEAQI